MEPLTGLAVDMKTHAYLGIESVWNDKNYWVNMQDCCKGIQGMRYDLGSLGDWEYMLPSGVLNELLMPHDTQLAALVRRGIDIGDKIEKFNVALDYSFTPSAENEADGSVDKRASTDFAMNGISNRKPKADLQDKLLLVDLPISWVLPITFSKAEYDMRYPNFT